MEITSIKYISASPYMSKAQIQKLMNVSARTVTSRIAEIDQYVQKGRYGAHTILDGCGVTYVNYLAFVDFLKYRKDLKAGRRVPQYDPKRIAEQIAWGTLAPEHQ
jgi:hypothetical protein